MRVERVPFRLISAATAAVILAACGQKPAAPPPQTPEVGVFTKSFGAQISRSGVDWLVMKRDGTLSDPHDVPKDRADAHPEIAWGTSDLFREGAPLVPFFAFMLESAGLAWFQSPAAGYDNPEFGMLVDKGVRVTIAHVTACPSLSS